MGWGASSLAKAMRSSLMEPNVDVVHKYHHLHHEIKAQVAFSPAIVVLPRATQEAKHFKLGVNLSHQNLAMS